MFLRLMCMNDGPSFSCVVHDATVCPMLIMGQELSEKVLHHQYASDKKGDGSSLSGGGSCGTNSSSEDVVCFLVQMGRYCSSFWPEACKPL
jgi:hypothetical protein